MVDAVWEHLVWGRRRRHADPGRRSPLAGLVAVLRWASALVALVLLGWGLVSEARTSYLQSRLLSRWAADMTFEVRPGPSDAIRFPRWGPYDERLGYTRLPSFIASLTAGISASPAKRNGRPRSRRHRRSGHASRSQRSSPGSRPAQRQG